MLRIRDVILFAFSADGGAKKVRGRGRGGRGSVRGGARGRGRGRGSSIFTPIQVDTPGSYSLQVS